MEGGCVGEAEKHYNTPAEERRPRTLHSYERGKKRERGRNNDADAELRVHTMHSYEWVKNEKKITIQIRTERAHEEEKRREQEEGEEEKKKRKKKGNAEEKQ